MSLIEDLTKLYSLDRQVRGLRGRLDNAERYLATQTRQLTEVEDRLAELQSQRRQLQARIANLETEGAAMDEQLEKFRGDLNSAATNKQYTAVLTELNTVKTARSKLDDTILSEMGEVERRDADIVEVEAQREERVKVRDLAQSQLKERETDVGDRLTELEAERALAAEAVPASDLEVFDHMADVYDGEAMAVILEIDRKRREYACGECNMHMPFEQVSVLMSSSSRLVRCTACGRILYMQEETRGALAPK